MEYLSPETIQIISTIGIPGTFMLGTLYLLGKTLKWLQPKVEALVNGHLSLIGSLEVAVKEISINTAAQAELAKMHDRKQEDIINLLKEISKRGSL